MSYLTKCRLLPITLSCRDHEWGRGAKFQQWDGTQWTPISDWIAPDQALVRPLVEAAAKYVQEKGITPRDCPWCMAPETSSPWDGPPNPHGT